MSSESLGLEYTCKLEKQMKKIVGLMAVLALTFGNAAFAQNKNGNGNMGQGAYQAGVSASDDFAWGPAIGGLAVLGVVVGLTAAAAASTPSTFSH